ncbi:hypothetical protein V2G26_014671 [Clonostachys chloroleuca]
MCTYKQLLFECKHVVWAGCVKRCSISENYQQGRIVHKCMIKEGHPWHSLRLLQDCQGCREKCSKVVSSHPTDGDEKGDIKPIDGEDMEHGENHDAESHQDYEPDSTTKVGQDPQETDGQDPEPDSTTKVDQDSQETDNQDSEPDSTTKVDQESRETDDQDGWIYSLNGRLQSCRREVEIDTESSSLPDIENTEPQTLAEKDVSPVISARASKPFRSCIPQQRKTNSRLPEALPGLKNPGTPSDTKIQIKQKSDTASDKDRETARTTSALPILRAIPKPKPIDVAADSHHLSSTPRLSIPIARKSSVGKVLRLPQPTRAMNFGLLKGPDRTLI